MSDKGRTRYSRTFKGCKANYKWPVSFDVTDGFLGISQKSFGGMTERILLSPSQYKALLQFMREDQQ